MSRKNRNFVIAYVLLVGLPFVGFFGVLKSGRKLAAPFSVGGEWELQGDLSQFAALPCGSSVPTAEHAVLNISQSGRNFELDLPNGFATEIPGVVDGTKLTATLSPMRQSREKGCGKDHALSVIATLDPAANPRSIEGTISVDGCSTCALVRFLAVRGTPVPKKAAH